ncbi:hypothetical protein L8106_18072 [Lyngbya sp. PCC 8106]|nr:hypothetical protein L8106_18072 [Lyngbya sp. PCC 8106]
MSSQSGGDRTQLPEFDRTLQERQRAERLA